LTCSGFHVLFAVALIIHIDSILREGHIGLFPRLETASLGPGGRVDRGARCDGGKQHISPHKA
jgi:hypothetical protein